MKILKKCDYLLIFIVAATALYFNFFLTSKLMTEVNDGNVVVYYKNSVYGTYDLETNQVITITTELGFNEIDINNGTVHIADADCKDKYCVKDKPIEYNNQTIVCLPHQVIVKVENNEESEIDSFVR